MFYYQAKFLFSISVFSTLVGLFCFCPAVSAMVTINTDTVWHRADSPFFVNDFVWVTPSSTLTIEPGVVVKFGDQDSLGIGGHLSARGTAGAPIIFTSIKDDEHGGDTNGDGNASVPQAGDWINLSCQNGSDCQLDHAQILYGGGAMPQSFLDIFHGSANINHSLFTHNSAGMMVNEGTVSISNSSFYGNLFQFRPGQYIDSGINNSGRVGRIIPVEAADNWWGSADGPCDVQPLLNGTPIWQADLAALCGTKPIILYSNVNFTPWLTAEPTDTLDPVIVLPGILGSFYKDGAWRMEPIHHTYENLLAALRGAGYQDDATLFPMPYQWRASNEITAVHLKQKIDEIKAICQCDKVDIVAHSMGGLVARRYIESDDYGNDVDQIIFLGTPHQGSIESYLRYEGGYFTGKDALLFKFYVSIEAAAAGYSNVVDYIRERVPTVRELLPIYAYLADRQTNGSYSFRSYGDSYPRNIFLENLNTTDHLARLYQRTRVTNIIGNFSPTSTINFIRTVSDPNPDDNKWQHGYPEGLNQNENALAKGEGDGTVPYFSADFLPGASILEFSAEHIALPTVAQKEVIEILTGQRPQVFYNQDQNYAADHWAIFSVYSPVDFQIIAPDGKRIGKDFATGQTVNEIPDAFYSGFDTDTEFVTIPEPIAGEYRANIQGVSGGGDYTFTATFVDENNPSATRDLSISSSVLPGSVDSALISHQVGATATSTIESSVDFDRLVALVGELERSGDVRNVVAKKALVKQFELYHRLYDKIINSWHSQIRRLYHLVVKLEAKISEKLIKDYAKRGWLTERGKNILLDNLTLLIDKLK